MIPTIPNYAYRNIVIPELTGGINKSKDATLIDDNQLADGLNVWQNNGILQTRPGIASSEFNIQSGGIKYVFDISQILPLSDKQENKTAFLIIAKNGFYIKESNEEEGKKLTIAQGDEPKYDAEFSCNLVLENDQRAYLFTSYIDTNKTTPIHVYLIDKYNTIWSCTRVFDSPTFDSGHMSQIYIPTIATNVGPAQKKEGFRDTWSGSLSRSGVLYEGYNLLSSYYKVQYSTVLQFETGDNINADKMVYKLPYNAEIENKTVYTKIDFGGGAKYFKTEIKDENKGTITGDNGEEAYWGGMWNPTDGTHIEDGYKMRVKGDEISFWRENKNPGVYEEVTLSRNDYIQNNMEVTAPLENSVENFKKVVNMTFNTWYGGNSEGIYGGTHLFMGGNTYDSNKNLVIWSDINKPLYFSENTYSKIGTNNQKVTAFGKQGESLIIFKEKELYSANYNSYPLSAEGVTVDVVASDAVFNISQIHGYIGCDCPNTVQLCRNRLVWLNSNGEAYSLVSANQYNERAVYKLSKNIEKELKNISSAKLTEAIAVDWKDHYVILVSNKIFLMDYNSYGFSSVYSYSKNEGAENNIPWWIWNIPKSQVTDDRSVYLMVIPTSSDLLYFEVFIGAAVESTVYPTINRISDSNLIDTCVGGNYAIKSHIQTKTFDFGLPTLKKNVPRIEVVLGNNEGTPIIATVITENGTNESEIRLINENSDIGEMGHFQTEVIKPVNRINYRIALKLETEGKLEVSDLVLQYKRLGGKK